MKWAAFVGLAILAGCGARASAPRGPVTTARAICPPATHWNGQRCQARDRTGSQDLIAGSEALDAFRVDEAVARLDRARQHGPHRYSDHIRIYEQLGIAHAYLGAEDAARDAFAMLLSLDPAHLLSYTLSPKATFAFERAREQARQNPRPALDLGWPHDLEVGQAIPIDLEVIADPRSFLARAELRIRQKGQTVFRAVDIDLPAPGQYERVVVPAVTSHQPEVLELYLVAFDKQGNEVLLWADAERPREIPLAYHPGVPWYRKWWVWATLGGVLAASTGAAVYAFSQEPPDTVDGHLEL